VIRSAAREASDALAPAGRGLVIAAFAALVALAALPLLGSGYTEVIATEILIFALFAASLHFIIHIGGLISFGHAAYFGLGAYAAALFTNRFGAAMEFGLVLSVVTGILGALVFGWFCVRLSGVYLAMLTLAFAQIIWSIAFQSRFTGGDNGILGVWPSAWLATKTAYYYAVLVLVAASLFALRRMVFSPFGYALRAGRDSPLRAEAIGVNVGNQRWLAFAASGGFAGLAGGLYAFHNGSVFPNVASIAQSVDGLLMVLLGGLQTLSGPIVGAAVFHLLKTELVRATEYWRLVLGLAIILLVIAFPQGIAGFLRQRFLKP
jgi:branched-chain amino acid transport system permease protein